MNKEKLIEMGVANQSVAMQVQRKLHNTPDVRLTEVRIDNPEDYITIDSMDNSGQRREQSMLTIAKDNNVVWQGNFNQLAQILSD